MARRVSVILLIALLASACARSSVAKSPATRPAAAQPGAQRAAAQPANGQPTDAGFIPLFNGKDLTGWVHATKAGQGYRVGNDGDGNSALYCTAEDGGNLFTQQQYADFVLRFEFKLSPGANNGVGIRAPRRGKVAYQGMEIQVLDDTAEKYAHLRPAQYHGSIYDVVPAERGHLEPVGQWNVQEITARGSRITIRLNGAVIVDADLVKISDEKVLARHPGIRNETGHIGFLGHGSEVHFRNIRIKPL